MLGKVFWGMVILLFVAVLVIPFVLPSYYANEAEAQYYESEGDDDSSHYTMYSGKKRKSKSVRSKGGSRSYRSGK
ncbi:MAG: hypothetical protein D3924_15585 [Candidatus Electrothrix sp. AR4]|nr:hypothetical protein [Candidatus Electrothrix sp. AR4]